MKRRADLTLDFSGVETKTFTVPDDNYLLEVVSVEEKESGEGNPYLAWKWKVVDGPHKGATLYDNTSLKSTALWRLKGLLECLGMKVDGRLSLNLAELKGKKAWASTTTETYQGKEKSRIAEFLRQAPDGASGSSASSSSKPKVKVGSRVQFSFDGHDMIGEVTEVEGKKISVEVEFDGAKEVWEMETSEVTLVSED